MDDTLLRDVNRHIYDVAQQLDWVTDYVCECGAIGCVETLEVSRSDVCEILAMPDSLLVAPGHEPSGTSLVLQRRGYLVLRRPG